MKGNWQTLLQTFSKIINQTDLTQGVYNETRKMTEKDANFMTESEVLVAVLSLKIKNSEGYDRIPQRVLIDGMILNIH